MHHWQLLIPQAKIRSADARQAVLQRQIQLLKAKLPVHALSHLTIYVTVQFPVGGLYTPFEQTHLVLVISIVFYYLIMRRSGQGQGITIPQSIEFVDCFVP